MPCKPLSRHQEVHPEKADLSSVRSFVARVPALLETFLEEAGSERELMLRAELRRTIDRLSGAFNQAASIERDWTQATVLRAAALVAHQLADAAEPAPADH